MNKTLEAIFLCKDNVDKIDYPYCCHEQNMMHAISIKCGSSYIKKRVFGRVTTLDWIGL